MKYNERNVRISSCRKDHVLSAMGKKFVSAGINLNNRGNGTLERSIMGVAMSALDAVDSSFGGGQSPR
jgi:hypothetical protein